MAASGGVAKICVVCNTDCASKPRTKDNKGRYYCQECYDKNRSQHGQKTAAEGSKPPAAKPRPSPKPQSKSKAATTDLLAVEDDPGQANFLEELITAAPLAEPAGIAVQKLCAGCGQAVHPDAVLCTACGFNLQTQSKVGKTKIQKAPRQSTGGVFWPPLIGIVSMVLGGGGVLLYGACLLLVFLGAAKSGEWLVFFVGPIPFFCLFTSLSAWLFRDGLRILRHDSDGIKWIRFWAMAKLLVFGTCLTAVMSIPTHRLDEGLAQAPRGSINVTASDIKSSFLLIMLWFMAWPIVMMIFFFIPRIQQDVDQWD